MPQFAWEWLGRFLGLYEKTPGTVYCPHTDREFYGKYRWEHAVRWRLNL